LISLSFFPSPILPQFDIGFHGPAYSDEQIDTPAMDLLSAVAFSSSSDFFQRWVIEEQVCQSFSASFCCSLQRHLQNRKKKRDFEEDLKTLNFFPWPLSPAPFF
jgi:predicted Zn-dependent peptidase